MSSVLPEVPDHLRERSPSANGHVADHMAIAGAVNWLVEVVSGLDGVDQEEAGRRVEEAMGVVRRTLEGWAESKERELAAETVALRRELDAVPLLGRWLRRQRQRNGRNLS